VLLLLLPELALKIVKEVKKLIDEEIIVVNKDGIIIASTDQKRVGEFHEGALTIRSSCPSLKRINWLFLDFFQIRKTLPLMNKTR
jgi:sugar diacid utilization regulator